MKVPENLIPWLVRVTGRNKVFLTQEAAKAHAEKVARQPRPFGPPARLRGVEVSMTVREGWPVYTVVPSGARPSGCVVFVHGGGWVNEIVRQHWKLIAQIAIESRTTVVVPIYPLIPVGTAATVVAEIVDIVLESRERYGDVRLAGDSAGGQISLSAAQVLRDSHGVTLSRTVLISPAADLTWSNPRIPEVQPDDPWLAVPGGHYLSSVWRGDLELTNPLVSPLFGGLAGLGPVVIFSGTRDILNPDASLLASKLEEAGVEVEYHEQPGGLHDYPLLPTANGERARRLITSTLAAPAVD